MEVGMDDYQCRAKDMAIYGEQVKNMLSTMASPQREEMHWLLCFLYSVLGLAGEAGELANKAKKLIRDGVMLYPDQGRIQQAIQELKLELGDCQWYVADAASNLNVSLSDVARENIAKLKARKAAGTLGGSGDHR